MASYATRSIRPSARATLDVGMAIEPVIWSGAFMPIDMTVTAIVDGKEILLHTTRIDPRRPQDRHWLDASIALDLVAGRTVRLRFSARPILGPTAIPTLPVWADPTIVDLGPQAP